MTKIGRTLKNLLYAIPIASAMTFMTGCEPENSPPEAKIEVSPIKGNAPLEVRIKLTGEDLDGVGDIKKYRLNINKEVINSNSPIDIKRTFENPGLVSVYGEVFDSENEYDKTNVSSVEAMDVLFT